MTDQQEQAMLTDEKFKSGDTRFQRLVALAVTERINLVYEYNMRSGLTLALNAMWAHARFGLNAVLHDCGNTRAIINGRYVENYQFRSYPVDSPLHDGVLVIAEPDDAAFVRLAEVLGMHRGPVLLFTSTPCAALREFITQHAITIVASDAPVEKPEAEPSANAAPVPEAEEKVGVDRLVIPSGSSLERYLRYAAHDYSQPHMRQRAIEKVHAFCHTLMRNGVTRVAMCCPYLLSNPFIFDTLSKTLLGKNPVSIERATTLALVIQNDRGSRDLFDTVNHELNNTRKDYP